MSVPESHERPVAARCCSASESNCTPLTREHLSKWMQVDRIQQIADILVVLGFALIVSMQPSRQLGVAYRCDLTSNPTRRLLARARAVLPPSAALHVLSKPLPKENRGPSTQVVKLMILLDLDLI